MVRKLRTLGGVHTALCANETRYDVVEPQGLFGCNKRLPCPVDARNLLISPVVQPSLTARGCPENASSTNTSSDTKEEMGIENTSSNVSEAPNISDLDKKSKTKMHCD